jgi:predicted HicB family RNase H-like nuclease
VSGSTSRDEESRESRSIKIKPSILLKAHIEAVKEGKSLGWWVEEAIEEKLEREEKKVK